MKKLITLLTLLISFNVQGQFFKELYKDVFKYATVYVAGDINTPYETQRPDYFVRTNPNNLYAVPEVIDNTVYHPYDYRIGIGIRKLARFDYEIKGKHYYDGNENTKALSSPTAAVKGFEYLLHYEKERERSEEFVNSRFFIRHTGKNHIVKLEQREQGNVGFKYQSAEVRGRLPIGSKVSISAGVIARSHQKAFGYNPIEIWLNEVDDQGNTVNPWYSLGFEYGYDDIYYSQNDEYGNTTNDWYWVDSEGIVVAHTDVQFRDLIFGDLMNRYNNEIWDQLDAYAEVAPIVGFDVYHHTDKFWLHSYANWILPYHKYFKGDEQYSYLQRNGWGSEGDGDQWSDYQFGLITGWKLSKTLGIFIEGEYTKFWDQEIYNSSIGLNFRL